MSPQRPSLQRYHTKKLTDSRLRRTYGRAPHPRTPPGPLPSPHAIKGLPPMPDQPPPRPDPAPRTTATGGVALSREVKAIRTQAESVARGTQRQCNSVHYLIGTLLVESPARELLLEEIGRAHV